jgi:hypothetical protein
MEVSAPSFEAFDWDVWKLQKETVLKRLLHERRSKIKNQKETSLRCTQKWVTELIS